MITTTCLWRNMKKIITFQLKEMPYPDLLIIALFIVFHLESIVHTRKISETGIHFVTYLYLFRITVFTMSIGTIKPRETI